ncbi:E3 ubiquitin-protein ligase TRAIP-like [Melia azedarach]|uniref:E3 ubiquitin-protein ligase TRAIP-like n=1 Tax=Melia azedarach TaxID=155640 RepID=A0ACC1YYU6_MELAZ|nr:E3 ubiquitin-protein ligase TRAIP-like [Melia azedarach]
MAIDNKFGKTICSICYEDLKPIVEDLQVISICGHVFHELCLQQWFEYCSSAKKCTCPVCKQSCSPKNVSRLYFQSLGDQIDLTIPQKPRNPELEDPEILRGQVKRLEVKVSRLNSALESQQKELKEINDELCLSKERIREEVELKNEAFRKKTSLELLYLSKSQELDKSTSECLKLQERNMALAKELAALKLVSDLNLDEDEVLKFASLGNGANNKDTIDVLRKSLVTRNKNYTELMAKCNLLGREKARSCEKLNKAKDKMNKLKTRVQELETAIEAKDNEVLRALRVSKKTSKKGSFESFDNEVLRALKVSKETSRKGEVLKGSEDKVNSLSNCISLEDEMEQCSLPIYSLDEPARVPNDFPCSTKRENFNTIEEINPDHTKEGLSTNSHKKERNAVLYEDTSRFSSAVLGLSSPDSQYETIADVVYKSNVARIGAIPDEDVPLIVDDSSQNQPFLNIRKTFSSPIPLTKPGDVCFSSGVLGPDGTNRYLGKWCKRGQNKGSNNGDLIAVGADGRGGRIKVLRSSNQSSLDDKDNHLCAKRLKYGAKTSSIQSQGCLQIEHFFGRVNH